MSFNIWNETPRSITEIIEDLKFENKQLKAIVRDKDRQLEQLTIKTVDDWQTWRPYSDHES